MRRSNAAETQRRDEKAAILVVEDDLDIRELMQTCLEIQGFDVITAANGMEGLSRYKENLGRVHVVVTDLDMPAMNGAEMIQHIFKITPAMKVLVASGQIAGSEPPRTSCLQKPYTARELADAVNLLL
jgi:DNA-binding NtrC family response regulator